MPRSRDAFMTNLYQCPTAAAPDESPIARDGALFFVCNMFVTKPVINPKLLFFQPDVCYNV